MASDNDNNIRKRGNPEQIPQEDVSGDVEKMISEQGGIEGQRKQVNVESYSKAASMGQILKDLEFPTNKDRIIKFVQKQSLDDDLLSRLEKIEDKEYQNVSDVTKAAGLVYICSKHIVASDLFYELCIEYKYSMNHYRFLFSCEIKISTIC